MASLFLHAANKILNQFIKLISYEKEHLKIKMENKIIEIKSPISGTFYRAPSPESLPYAEIGQKVKSEDVICLVEQMKVFTEIMVENDGIIRKILVQNEDPVSEGQILFELEVL